MTIKDLLQIFGAVITAHLISLWFKSFLKNRELKKQKEFYEKEILKEIKRSARAEVRAEEYKRLIEENKEIRDEGKDLETILK